MESIFLETFSRPLLVLHGLNAGAVVGLLTHHALWSIRARSGSARLRRQSRMFIRLATGFTSLQLALGFLIYPTYRVRVRLAFFDQVIDGKQPLKWVSSLFDLKEHSAAALMALVLALWVGDLLQDEVHAGRFPRMGGTIHAGLAVLAAVLAWALTAVGLYISSFHGLPHGG